MQCKHQWQAVICMHLYVTGLLNPQTSLQRGASPDRTVAPLSCFRMQKQAQWGIAMFQPLNPTHRWRCGSRGLQEQRLPGLRPGQRAARARRAPRRDLRASPCCPASLATHTLQTASAGLRPPRWRTADASLLCPDSVCSLILCGPGAAGFS